MGFSSSYIISIQKKAFYYRVKLKYLEFKDKMSILLVAKIIMTSFFGMSLGLEDNNISYKQHITPKTSLEQKIIYIKAPTPWVKVINN